MPSLLPALRTEKLSFPASSSFQALPATHFKALAIVAFGYFAAAIPIQIRELNCQIRTQTFGVKRDLNIVFVLLVLDLHIESVKILFETIYSIICYSDSLFASK